MAMAATAPMASIMTVKCGCPGDLSDQQIDLEAVGVTLHCASCGGVITARFANLPTAVAYLTRLAEASGYTS